MNADSCSRGRWYRSFVSRSDCRVRLLCFHHAGGGASAFRGWVRFLAADVDLVAIQLPGRENRFSEAPYERMSPLVTELVAATEPKLDRPFAFFGYSMGARVALALAQALHAQGMPRPQRLFVAASPGPCLNIPVPGWDQPDRELLATLVSYGGVPPAFQADQELLELLLPTVRADLTTVATWPYQAGSQLNCPVLAFAGHDDGYASPELMRAWASETASSFELRVLPGGHFFIHRRLPEVVAAVDHELALAADGLRRRPETDSA